MKRETGEGSEDKQTSSDRDEFRRQQDIERERFRKELQERGGKKRITIGSVLYAVWVTAFILLAVLILAAMFLADF